MACKRTVQQARKLFLEGRERVGLRVVALIWARANPIRIGPWALVKLQAKGEFLLLAKPLMLRGCAGLVSHARLVSLAKGGPDMVIAY